ncbi:hypothetical protein M2371_003661 [Buttiauxella sp. BIGb0471]|nr:hypothetical protein [Buttiauxella sp. BIGb0471]
MTVITLNQPIITIQPFYVAQITIEAAISTSKWKTTRYKPLTLPDTLKA